MRIIEEFQRVRLLGYSKIAQADILPAYAAPVPVPVWPV